MEEFTAVWWWTNSKCWLWPYQLLENEFNESVAIIKPLQKEIQELESKINQLVYELYGLTTEEIDIIENSFKE